MSVTPFTQQFSSRLLATAKRRNAARHFSSVVAPVELRYDKYIPPNGNETENPLVIAHGLL